MAHGRQPSPSAGSHSPAPQPLSKRDVRRKRIVERLDRMLLTFNSNQHQHYRAQLQAIQADMTLILRADPYNGAPLEDGGEEIAQMVRDLGANVQGDTQAREDFDALAGVRYREFVREVNDQIEVRDAELTALRNNYDSSVAELDRLTQQKVHQAHEEHAALSNTIRQRLQATISKKRQSMMRDKESLDINDSNALLLHPDHFSINNNPGSPGNGQNRKTRHLRHRAGSPVEGGDNGKRKRKAANAEDDDNQSPAPAFRLPPPDALGGGRSPFKDARDKNAYVQYEAPAYSLERLFTDKELALATDTAKMATYQHFHQPRPDQNTQTNGTAVPSVDEENNTMDTAEDNEDPNSTAPAEATTNGTPAPGQPATAPDMERTTSHQVFTRGSARANPLAALTNLADAAAASSMPTNSAVRDNPFAPVIPSFHAVTRSEKSGAPAPPGVNALDIDNDIAMMTRQDAPANGNTTSLATTTSVEDTTMNDADTGNEDPTDSTARAMRRQLLDQALDTASVTQPYRLPLLEMGPALIGRGVDRIPGTGFAPVPSVLESKMRAGAGAAASGSLAAALQGRLGGGEPMSRTTSAGAGSEAEGGQPGNGRRGRGRA
ncbi:hypothetical protein MBLNU230_g4107t1 [Neophaeotheca triangularis]